MYINNMTANIILLNDTTIPALQIYFCRYAKIMQWEMKGAIAPHWRCYLPLSTGGNIIYKNKTIQLLPGTAYLIPPYSRFSTKMTKSFDKAFCHFNFEYNTMSFSPGIYCFDPTEQLFNNIKCTVLSKDGDVNWNFALLMTQLALTGLYSMPKENIKKIPSDKRIESLIKLMKSNFKKPLSNTELAKSVRLHENSFVRYFKQKTGKAPQKYYTTLRMEQACILLNSTILSIDEIAEQCGFWDRNHFSKVFAQHWNCPPAKFRNRF
jgi:AraC-like DNA-binding protein